jgi:sulfur carrier protein
MRVVLNGEERDLSGLITVFDLLKHLGLEEKLVLVEQNGEAIARDRLASAPLGDGDTIEIVRMVAGG